MLYMDPYTSAAAQGGEFNGIEIAVVGLADPDYRDRLTSEIHPNGTVVFKSGFDFEILQLLQSALNFTHKAIDGEGWVDHLPNGTWTGIGRQIQDEEAAFSIAQSTMLPDRAESFDFLMSTTKGYLVASFRQPPSNSVRNMITSGFPFYVWMSWIMMGILVVLSAKLIKHVKERLDLINPVDCLLIPDFGFWVLGSFCQKGLSTTPDSVAIRIVYLSLLTSTFFSYVAFSAVLLSHLTIEIVPIRSFADLIRSDMPLFGDISVPFVSTIESYQRLKNQVGSMKQNFMDVKTGVDKITNGYAGFVTFPETLYSAFQDLNMRDHHICDNIFLTKVTGSVVQGGMLLKKGSLFRKKLNPGIFKLYERGFMARLRQNMDSKMYPRCPPRKIRSTKPSLRFNDVFTAFVILIVGVILSVLTLAIEFLPVLIDRNKVT